MRRSISPAGLLLVALALLQTAAFTQVAFSPWTIAETPGPSIGAVGMCATNAPGVAMGACVTLKAISSVTGNPGSLVTSNCTRLLTASTTLTVTGSRQVLFTADLKGFMQQAAPGAGLALVAASFSLDGNLVLDSNPLAPSQLYPPAPLTVSSLKTATWCVPTGAHSLTVTLNTYATNSSGSGALATTSDFFTTVLGVARGFTVCVIDQGPCPPWSLTISQPAGAGTPMVIANTNGAPFGTYFNAMTLTAGGFPAGWFLGIDILIGELATQLGAGIPFLGVLNGGGASVFTVPYTLGFPITLYYVGIELTGGGSVVHTDVAKTVTLQ